jgi:hypothetical protein
MEGTPRTTRTKGSAGTTSTRIAKLDRAWPARSQLHRVGSARGADHAVAQDHRGRAQTHADLG